ncbi:hypothetical protein B0H19DRAFT_1246997 [Mycena capillaripes]|nr:hypothetical protein B0H19DRAFT_1246997 [Mycena capillaripes]
MTMDFSVVVGGESFTKTYAVNIIGTVATTNAMRQLFAPGGAMLNISSGRERLWDSTTKLTSYAGNFLPVDGCKVIVKAALEKERKTTVFIGRKGDVAW